MFYADILFFAGLAAFIAFRLYSVLGQKDGTDQNITHKVKEYWEAKAKEAEGKSAAPAAAEPAAMQEADAAVVEEERPLLGVTEEAQKAVQKLIAKDASFNPEQFMGGANAAYEMILEGFARGDQPTLQRLLEPSLLEEFEADITRREEAGETRITTIVALVRSEISAASIAGKTASVTVAFESEQINCTKNAEGEVISGDEKASERLHDSWVFERDISSKNPNWMLVDTDA